MGIAFLLRTSINPPDTVPPYAIIDKDCTKVGRRSEICIDTRIGKEISKIHARIYRRAQNGREIWILEDNMSLNGTFVNGKKVHRVFLKSGDEIVFGGGYRFSQGDRMLSTDLAEARFKFFIPYPHIKFLEGAHQNSVLADSSLAEVCAICLGPLADAETLPCGHCFCASCLLAWAAACRSELRPAVCPMCRAPFKGASLRPAGAVLTREGWEVTNTEGFLRALHLKSCREIRARHIFKRWPKRYSQRFFAMHHDACESAFHCALFLHLAKATPNQIFAAPAEKLRRALKNLTGERPQEGTERAILILDLLNIIASRLAIVPPDPSPAERSYRRVVRQIE